MALFATFWTWLSAQLNGYIGSNTALLAAALEPTVITLATLYVMGWGYLQLTGQITEPFTAGLKRIVILAVVLGASLHLWLYGSVMVDTFYSAPAELAARLVGAGDPVTTIDAIWQQGGSVAEQLWDKGGVLNGGLGFYIAGGAVWLLIGTLCTYAMFLLALARIASAVLLALGPLFIVMLLFNATRRLFEAWVAQLANYALISVLTVLVAALLLRLVAAYAAQTAARGSALLTVDALDMVMVAALVLLLMRQIMPVAAGLAGGLALSSFGLVSRSFGWGATRAAAQAGSIVGGAAMLSAWAASRPPAAPAMATATAAAAPAGSAAAAGSTPSWRDRL